MVHNKNLWGLEVVLWTLSYSFFFFILAGILEGLAPGWMDQHYLMVDSISCLVLALAYGFIYYQQDKAEPLAWRLERAYWWPGLFMGLGLMGLSLAWFILAESYLSHLPLIAQSFESFEETWAQVDQEPYFWTLASVVLLGPLVEELLFRGLIFQRIKEAKGAGWAIWGSALLFGLWHLEPVQVVYTALIGLVLGLVREKTGSLRLPLALHIFNNFFSALPPGLAQAQALLALVDGLSLLALVPLAYYLFFWQGWPAPKGSENRDPEEARP